MISQVPQIFETTFIDGPAAGRVHRMTESPETWDVYAHRQSEGIVEIGPGRYGGHQESLWERFDYRRVDLTPDSAVYALVETPACMIRQDRYLGWDRGSEYDHVDNCVDCDHAHFWFPENWPGGRAPVRWTYKDRSDDRAAADRHNAAAKTFEERVIPSFYIHDYMGIQLWVPECCVGPEGSTCWWATQGVPSTPTAVIAAWRKMEAEFEAERDAILNAADELEEMRFEVKSGALPG